MTLLHNDLTTRAEISVEALEHNFRIVSDFVAPAKVMVVVKGDAYGHGAVETVKILSEIGCKDFWVAHLDEGLELKMAGIGANIHLLGGTTQKQLETVLQYGIIPFVNSTETLRYLEKAALKQDKVAKFHLKIDTGMGRLGLFKDEISDFCEELKRCKFVRLIGVGSHLAQAAQLHPLNDLQICRFENAVDFLEQEFDFVPRHLLASCGTVSFPKKHYEFVRVGSLIYGLCHLAQHPLPLKPTLALKTVVVQVKEVPLGWNIGYGENIVTATKKIALLPMGQVDGMTSVLGANKKAQILIRGKKASIVSIAADQMIADVTHIEGVARGDEGVVIGNQGEEEITARELGLQAESSYGEILMKISRRVPRIYHREGQIKQIRRLYTNNQKDLKGIL